MSEDRFLTYWRTGMTIAMAIVGAVAILLLAIIGTAQRILMHANRALAVGKEITETTRAIWSLEQTSAAASRLEAESRALELHFAGLADALESSRKER